MIFFLKKGFFGSLFAPEKIEVQSSSHSAKLSAKDESMIEFQTHNVKPDSIGTIHNPYIMQELLGGRGLCLLKLSFTWKFRMQQ